MHVRRSFQQVALVHRGLPNAEAALQQDAPQARVGRHVHSIPMMAPRPQVVGCRRDVIQQADLLRLEVGDAADLLAAATGQRRMRRPRHAEVIHIVGPDRLVIQQLEVGVDAPEIPDVD